MAYARGGMIALLTLGIVLPGGILAVFGFHSLRQDRLLAQRQTRDVLESALQVAGDEVTRELARWSHWNEPESALIILGADGTIESARGLLWWPGPLSDPPLGPDVDRAEQAEIRRNDFAQAIGLYETALHIAPARSQAALLLRIARTARKAGDSEKARACWRRILALPDCESTPAALLALAETGAAPAEDLYRGLIAGRFPIAPESYFFYVGRAVELLGESRTAPFRDAERRRLALTEAAVAFLQHPRRAPTAGFLAFWDESSVVVLPAELLRARLGKAAQTRMDPIITLDRPSTLPPISAVRPLADAELPWQLTAVPRDWAAAERSLRNRQNLYLGSLALVLAVLLSGVLLTARALRREAEFSHLQSEFVATVSHEFRSPLTGIRQLAELLHSDIVTADERRKEYYGLILQESGRLTRLVENLLDLSRLEAARKRYQMEEIESSAWLIETAAAARNPRLHADIPVGLPSLRGDRDALASVVGNLMDNAMKYSPPEAPVWLKAWAANGIVSISVSDQGPGIPLEEQARIFEKFYRGEGELSADEGRGYRPQLGETHCRGPRWKRLGGEPARERQHLHHRPRGRRRSGVRRILVVEDEPVIALGLRDSLEAEGYSVEVEAEGVAAETRARQGRCDLILLDIMLPGRDGLSICRNLRSAGIATPIILLTARGQEVDKIHGLDLGVDDYITKPFSRGELMARVRAVLRRHATPTESLPGSYRFGEVTVDFARHEAFRDGRALALTPIEFKMLGTFIEQRGRVLRHDEIIERVWGPSAFLSDRVLYTHVNNLRGKIEPEPSQPRYLVGVRGIGYRFEG
jgi:DNA-binding response OmpR family regulator/signal transduction histidine kinase